MRSAAGRHLRQWAVLAALLLLLLAAAVQLRWFERADNWLYDTGIVWSARAASSDIVIVAIDEDSLARLGRWPWTRQHLAAMVEQLHAAGSGPLLLDAILSEPQRDDPGADMRLAAAIAAHGRVVLPVFMPGALSDAVLPLPQFARSARLGHAQALVDRDGVSRRYLLWEAASATRYPHVAALLLWPSLTPPPPTELQATLVPYCGPAGHYLRVSAADLLAGLVPQAVLRGKTILFGATATGLGDNLVTPWAGVNGTMPGVEFVANVLDALGTGRVLRPVAGTVHLATTAAMLLVVLLALLLTSPRMALLVTLGAAVLAVLVAWALLRVAGLWWPPGALVAAIALAYPLWSWRRLEASLSTMTRETARIAALSRPGGDAVLASTSYLDPVETRIAAISAAVDQIALALTLEASTPESRQQRDDMMRHLAHDLRSPLVSLRALAGQLRNGDSAHHAALLERVDVCARRSLDLTEQFLLLGRAQTLDPAGFAEVDLVQLLHQCADDLWEDAQRSGAQIRRQCVADIALVQGDARLLQRALLNLGWNALRHGPPGGVVTLALQVLPDACVLSVHDQGAGFAPGQLEHLSQRNTQGAQGKDGYGLGLPLVQLVARKHHGKLRADHPPGGGFRLSLHLVYTAPRVDPLDLRERNVR